MWDTKYLRKEDGNMINYLSYWYSLVNIGKLDYFLSLILLGVLGWDVQRKQRSVTPG